MAKSGSLVGKTLRVSCLLFFLADLAYSAPEPGVHGIDFKNAEYPWINTFDILETWGWLKDIPSSRVRLKDGHLTFKQIQLTVIIFNWSPSRTAILMAMAKMKQSLTCGMAQVARPIGTTFTYSRQRTVMLHH